MSKMITVYGMKIKERIFEYITSRRKVSVMALLILR